MKVVHDESNDVLTGKVSNVLLLKTNKVLPNNAELFQFSEKIRSTVGFCSNIYGRRSANMCSHQMVALLYYHKVFNDLQIQVATPRVVKQFKNIKNIGPAVGRFYNQSIKEQIDCIDNTYNDEYEYISSDTDHILEIDDNESDVAFY